jgi:Mg-chelatase subunit ChlD
VNPEPSYSVSVQTGPVAPVTLPPPIVAAAGGAGAGSAGQTGGAAAAGGSKVAGGPTFLQTGGRVESVVYLIDRSLSMGLNGGLEAAKREVLASLRQLPASARFQVLFYDTFVTPLSVHGSSGLLPATPDNVAQAARQIEAVCAGGATDHRQALREALALAPQPQVVFLVTDADDLTAEDARRVTQMNHGVSVIHAVELTATARPRREGAFAALAQANGGSYRTVHIQPGS